MEHNNYVTREELKEAVDRQDNRLESLENRFQSLDNRLESLENRLESLENRLESLENRLEKYFNILSDSYKKLVVMVDRVTTQDLNNQKLKAEIAKLLANN